MKTTIRAILLLLALVLPARAYITTSPGGGGGGGPTNGITQAAAAGLINSTNGGVTVPQINTSSNLLWRNFTNATQGGTSNLNVGAIIANGKVIATNGLTIFDSNLKAFTSDSTFSWSTASGGSVVDIALSDTGGGQADIEGPQGQSFQFNANGAIAMNDNGGEFVVAGPTTGIQLNDGNNHYAVLDTNAGNFTLSGGGAFTGDGSGLTNIPGSGLRNPLNVPTLNATNFFDYAATNGANTTNILMLNTNGAPQYGIIGSGLSWNAATRTLSSTGSAPNGLVTNNAPADVVVANAGVNTTITSNSVTTGTVTVNGGSSNVLGGISYIRSNAAPYTLATPAGLNTIALNQGWTNNFNRQADLIIQVLMTGADTRVDYNILAYTNAVSGECWTNAQIRMGSGITNNYTVTLIFPDISPNDFGSFSNYVTGTPVLPVIQQAKWKLK